MSIGTRLYNLRVDSNLSIAEISKRFDIARNTVYRWEHNLFVPTRFKLVELADFYGVSVDWILKGVVIEENDLEKKLNVPNFPSVPTYVKAEKAISGKNANQNNSKLETDSIKLSSDIKNHSQKSPLREFTHSQVGQKQLLTLFEMLSTNRQGRLLGYLDALCSEELAEKYIQ